MRVKKLASVSVDIEPVGAQWRIYLRQEPTSILDAFAFAVRGKTTSREAALNFAQGLTLSRAAELVADELGRRSEANMCDMEGMPRRSREDDALEKFYDFVRPQSAPALSAGADEDEDFWNE